MGTKLAARNGAVQFTLAKGQGCRRSQVQRLDNLHLLRSLVALPSTRLVLTMLSRNLPSRSALWYWTERAACAAAASRAATRTQPTHYLLRRRPSSLFGCGWRPVVASTQRRLPQHLNRLQKALWRPLGPALQPPFTDRGRLKQPAGSGEAARDAERPLPSARARRLLPTPPPRLQACWKPWRSARSWRRFAPTATAARRLLLGLLSRAAIRRATTPPLPMMARPARHGTATAPTARSKQVL